MPCPRNIGWKGALPPWDGLVSWTVFCVCVGLQLDLLFWSVHLVSTLHQSFNFVFFLKVISNTFLSQLVCFFKMSTWILNFIILANEHFGKNFILIDLTSVVLEHATDLHLPNLQLCSKYSIYQVCQHLYSNLSLSI